MSKNTIPAGFRYIWYGVVNSSGVFIGSTTTAPTAGTAAGSGMLRLDGARTLPVNIAEPTIVSVTGDDEPMVQFEFDSESLPSGLMEVAQRFNTFDALVQGTLAQTVGSIEIGVLDPKDRTSQSMCLLLSRRAKSWAGASKGAALWDNLYVPQCTIKPLGNTYQERTFNAFGYAINLSRSGRLGWTTVNNTEHGTTAASMFYIDSDNPLYMHRFTGNNALLTFTLSYPPVSAARTYVFVNDLQQTATTDYSISGTSLIFVAAPANNAVIVVLSEIDESDLS